MNIKNLLFSSSLLAWSVVAQLPADVEISLENYYLFSDSARNINIYAENLTEGTLKFDGWSFYLHINGGEEPAPYIIQYDVAHNTLFDGVNYSSVEDLSENRTELYWNIFSDDSFVYLKPGESTIIANISVAAFGIPKGTYSLSFASEDWSSEVNWMGSIDNVETGGYNLRLIDGNFIVVPENEHGLFAAFGLFGWMFFRRNNKS